MNLDTSYLIKNLISGTLVYLKEMDLDLSVEQENILESSLKSELEKDFKLQKKTPTQIINIFLNEELKLNIALTPHDLGEKARDQIIIWGISKAKNLEGK
jgi:hypothetical protein